MWKILTPVFFSPDCLAIAEQGNQSFHENSSKEVAFNDMMERIETTTNVAGKMMTPTQIIKLVETCDPNVEIKFKMLSWKSEPMFKI